MPVPLLFWSKNSFWEHNYAFYVSDILHVCRLFQTNQGILSMLDEECLKPGHGSDEGFLSRMNTTCAGHPHFMTVGDNSSPAHCFRLVSLHRSV